MRKLVCLIMVCILASVFVSVSNASALGKNKILNTQWLISGTMKVYLLTTGQFLGAAAGGSGIMSIDENKVVTGTYAITFDTTIPEEPLVLGTRADFTLSETTYNAKKGLLKGTSCAVNISYPEGVPKPPLIYEDVCDATISFASPRTFKGKISFTIEGITVVIETSGTLLGKPVSLAPPP
jgi:hypothetical protein